MSLTRERRGGWRHLAMAFASLASVALISDLPALSGAARTVAFGAVAVTARRRTPRTN